MKSEIKFPVSERDALIIEFPKQFLRLKRRRIKRIKVAAIFAFIRNDGYVERLLGA